MRNFALSFLMNKVISYKKKNKYGDEVLRELEEENRIKKKKKRQFPEIQNVNQTVAFL